MQGKVVAITGASSGIGRAVALLLAARGDTVVLAARGTARLAAVADEVAAAGGTVAHLPADVTRRADLDALVALACERFGRLDVLVSNAGAMPIGPIEDLAVDNWERMVDINLKGVLFGVAAALPAFRRQGSGHFVNVVSTAARKTVPGQTVYSATKAAVLALSDGLRQELAGRFRVTAISPGFTDTDVVSQVADEALRAQIAAASARFAMPPDAVARAVAYAIDQPDALNIGEIVVRSTAQP